MTLGNVNFRERPTHYNDDDVGVDDDVHDDVDDVDVDDLGQHQLPGKSAPAAHTRTHTVDQSLRVCITLQSLHDYTSRGMALHITRWMRDMEIGEEGSKKFLPLLEGIFPDHNLYLSFGGHVCQG